MDFYRICTKDVKGEPLPFLFPDFVVGRSKDIMIRGKAFYAIWDEEEGLWSQDEYAVQRIVDKHLKQYADEARQKTGTEFAVKYLSSFGNNGWKNFQSFIKNISDNSHDLDQNLTFQNQAVKKTDYASRRLPYALEPGDHSAWDELVGTLYNTEERAKIEWFIGAIVSGDHKKIQKFAVFYGPPGSGKSTMMNIILKLFNGYETVFDAKALGSSNAQFATEVFKNNPLVAIQQDGDLSKIDDNTKINSITAHEEIPMNEKYKAGYRSKVNATLFMGTNQPVRISDAKSGLIRRLIDIHPTGVSIPENHYNTLMSRVDFELGAIAHHCLGVYQNMGRNYYSGYRPLEMMLQTDVFFNFIEYYYDVFKSQDATSLRQAYQLYKEYCDDTNVDRRLPQYKFREELRNYFDEYRDRGEIDGQSVRSWYGGFNASKFKSRAKKDTVFSLVIEDTESLFDALAADWPAQYEIWDEEMQGYRPARKWSNVTTKLSEIDTAEIHYVKVPKNMIVIDFDLKDESGEKSLERNLEAASAWPATYGELSKSGRGVHLVYLYDGDVSELSGSHSDGVEVKTLLGDAALRRKLSHCNNIPVATLGDGALPKKEKKVLTEQQIKSEVGLRALIARNLRKEIHPNTSSSISFIKKILDEAYEKKEFEYDLTDLRSPIMAFALNSTNQSFNCLKMAQTMKFVSEQGAEVPDQTKGVEAFVKDDRLCFFDIEVYPNLFVICYKMAGDADVVKMINPSAEEVAALFKLKLVGYNCRRYDNHIMYAASLGYTVRELFELSQAIIVDRNRDKMFGNAYAISYTDIYDYASVKQSLKMWQIQLGLPHVELDIPWDQDVPEELIPVVVDYCCNDVISTEATHNARKQDFVARQILAELSGLSVNDSTARHAAKIIFGNDKNPQASFVYPHLEEEFEGYVWEAGKSQYRGMDPSEGGFVYSEPGIYFDVPVADVASMHPTSIVQLNLFGEYTVNFRALMDARLAIKRKDFDTAREMFGGKLRPFLEDTAEADALAYALKIIINIVYGLTSAKFDNSFRDIRNKDNVVAKRGALFMIDLLHACQEKGLKVAHIKTDSIKIPGATQEDLDEIINFGAKYGYEFEIETTYERFCLVNDAVYIAREDGQWTATGAQFAHPYVFKTLFSQEVVTFDDLCETKQVQKGTMYLDFQHDSPTPLAERGHDGMVFVGRVGKFVPVKEGTGGAILYKIIDGKPFKVTGTSGYLWMPSEMAEPKGLDVIDMTYYEKLAEDAKRAINKFGSFEEFIS